MSWEGHANIALCFFRKLIISILSIFGSVVMLVILTSFYLSC